MCTEMTEEILTLKVRVLVTSFVSKRDNVTTIFVSEAYSSKL